LFLQSGVVAVNVIEHVAPAAMELLQVLLVTFAKTESLVMPESVGVIAIEFGFLNVVVFEFPLVIELTIVKATGGGKTIIVNGTLKVVPPADEVAEKVPLKFPTAFGVVTVTVPHEPVPAQ
jgi:hypothetical protein